MRKHKLLAILFFISIFFSSKAEIIKETTSIRSKPNGKTTFILFEKSKIVCGIPNDQWIEIVYFIPSTKEYFDRIKKLKKGDVLIDSTGRKVGEITSDEIQYMPMHNNVNDKYLLRLEGYIPLKSIDESSIPEKYLERKLSDKKNNVSYEDLKDFMSKYNFYRLDDFLHTNKYECYFYYADYFWDNNIHLVFENRRLIAILHTRDLQLQGFEDIKMATTYILWLKNNGPKEKESFVNKFRTCFEDPGE